MIARIAIRRSQPLSALPRVAATRSVTTLSKALYTAKAQSTGQGRNGKSSLLEDGPFEVKLAYVGAYAFVQYDS
jgi:hypothetical protein